jgi:transposase
MVYSEKDIQQIQVMREANLSWGVIAKTIGKSSESLRVWWHRNKKILHIGPKPKPIKTAITGAVGRQIKRIVQDNPRISVRNIAFQIQGDVRPSKSSIQRFLHKNNIVTLKLLKKPLITAQNIEKRKIFAEKGMENLHELMCRTIWSDETTVRKMPNSKQMLWKCHSSTSREDLPVNSQIQQGGFSVMFWGCFSFYGLGPLVALDGNQNQYTYIETLRKYLIPEIFDAREKHGIELTFMQDNAPCHKTAAVRDFLDSNFINTLEWPPQSPDLNPIENLWAIIKRRRCERFGIPKSKIDLIEQVFQIWEEISDNEVYALSVSIKKRLEEALRLNGRPTKY